MNQRIQSAGICKRSGIEICEAVYVLLLWKWVGVKSIAMLCCNCMETFIDSGKDVLYNLLKREDINWRAYNLNRVLQVYCRHRLDQS